MATSLTNNVLTFDHGSIKDVKNDRSLILPISLNVSKSVSFSSSSPSTAVVSGSPGQVVSAAAFNTNGNYAKITSNGGVWLYSGGSIYDYSGSISLTLPYYPLFDIEGKNTAGSSESSGMNFYTKKIGAINYSNSSSTKVGVAVLALRLA